MSVPLFRRSKVLRGAELASICLATLLSAAMPIAAAQRAQTGAAGASVRALAQELVAAGGVHFTGDVACEIGDGIGRATNLYAGSDVDALLMLAARQRIFFFVHGFYPNARRPRPPIEYALDTWVQHRRAAQSMGVPVATCVFAVDTSVGFGERQSTIGDLLFAVRALTDLPALYSPSREVTLMGYSAGANYVKQAVVTFQSYLAQNGVPPIGQQPTRMSLVFLAGVHNGTDVAMLAASAVQLLNSFGRAMQTEPRSYQQASEQRWQEYLRSEQEALVTSRGARQLWTESADLRALNDAFQRGLTSNLRILNLGGTADSIATASAVRVPFGTTVFLPGMQHGDFVGVTLPSVARDLLTTIYGGWLPGLPARQ